MERAIVCLGAAAEQALLGKSFKVPAQRGIVIETALAPLAMATVHPSSILRVPDADRRRREMNRFTGDLRKLFRRLARDSGGQSPGIQECP